LGYTEVDEVNDQNGNAGYAWDEEFVSPADVEEVITNAEEGDGLEREDGGEVRC
jgi:hypothetical protein